MKTITLYNNYPDTTYFEQKRKELYNTYADIQCYDDESDVPCSFIKSEIDYENEVQYYGIKIFILRCCSNRRRRKIRHQSR